MRGRPNKPTIIKELQGTLKKSREKKPSIEYGAIHQVPDPPDSFDEVAKNVWDTICKEMINLQILQNLDIFLLQILCNEMSVYWKCYSQMSGEYIIPTGTGSYKTNPLFTAASQSLNNAMKIASQFGLSPAARQRIRLDVTGHNNKENKAKLLISKKKSLK
jgi:P27 family predicted phage terminase small subunit